MRVPILLSLLLLGLPAPAAGPASPAVRDGYGFQFVRIKYDGIAYSRGRTWAYDWPTAERNLYTAIERTTRLYIEGEPLVLTLDDERIFEHPVLYLCEPGYWLTNDEEVQNLQKYLARGGFLIIDDFHDFGGKSGHEWSNFYDNIKRVFPDREPVEVAPSHPIWSIYYDIDPVEAASTKRGFSRYDDQYYAIYDDDGRMVVMICYNQDIGDGWEWPGDLAEASTVSFQMAINFILYALTH